MLIIGLFFFKFRFNSLVAITVRISVSQSVHVASSLEYKPQSKPPQSFLSLTLLFSKSFHVSLCFHNFTVPLIHVFFGLYFFLSPERFRVKACLAILSLWFLGVCSVHFHFSTCDLYIDWYLDHRSTISVSGTNSILL